VTQLNWNDSPLGSIAWAYWREFQQKIQTALWVVSFLRGELMELAFKLNIPTYQ
jgi:hypothetical protein